MFSKIKAMIDLNINSMLRILNAYLAVWFSFKTRIQSLNVINDVLILHVSVNCFPVLVEGSFPAKSQISRKKKVLCFTNNFFNETYTYDSLLVLLRIHRLLLM